MDIISELKENNVVLLIMKGSTYNKESLEVAKNLGGKRVCYVTLNKTHESLEEIFKRNKINIKYFFFIDAISKTFKEKAERDIHCQIIEPGSLTELSLVIGQILNQGFDYLVFDAVSNLFIYHKKEEVLKFALDMINKIKKSKTKGIIYSLHGEEDVLQKMTPAVDSVIEP